MAIASIVSALHCLPGDCDLGLLYIIMSFRLNAVMPVLMFESEKIDVNVSVEVCRTYYMYIQRIETWILETPSRSDGAPLYIYIYIYIFIRRCRLWSPRAPALRANVKPAQSHPVTARTSWVPS